MAIKRPKVKTDVAANRRLTSKVTQFAKLRPDSHNFVRLLPPFNDKGHIFYVTTQHFGFKDLVGDKEIDNRAFACLRKHGDNDTGDCPICEIMDYIKGEGDKDTAEQFRRYRANSRYIAQMYLKRDVEAATPDNPAKPKLVGLPVSATEGINKILGMQEELGQTFINDEEGGQWIDIHIEGSGMQSEYSVMQTSQAVPLAAIDPAWESNFLDVVKETNLVVRDRATMLDSIVRTLGKKLDLAAIFDPEELNI